MTATLVLDEDGIYDPTDFNDRLLLGLKGVVSEAELHMLKSRLWGGTLNKARRGELKVPLPVGLAYDPLDRVVLDPDAQVQSSIRILFDTFGPHRLGQCGREALPPREPAVPSAPARRGRGKGDLVWQPLTLWRRPADLAQSALCRRLRVRPQQESTASGWRIILPARPEG